MLLAKDLTSIHPGDQNRDAAPFDWEDITPLFTGEPIWNYGSLVYFVDADRPYYQYSDDTWYNYSFQPTWPIRFYANRLLEGLITR